MILTLKLSRHRIARVWLGEAPTVEVIGQDTVRQRVASARLVEAVTTKVVAELLVPRGGMASYGVLGGEFTRSSSGNEVEIIALIGSGSNRYQESIAARIDEVRVGLPREFADAVIRGAKTEVLNRGTPPGVLTFRWAAHGVVGSSPAIFEQLSSLVLRIMATPADCLTEERLSEYFD